MHGLVTLLIKDIVCLKCAKRIDLIKGNVVSINELDCFNHFTVFAFIKREKQGRQM